MDPHDDDARLKETFARLREEDRRRAPDFRAMWTAPRRARSPWLVAGPVIGLAAAAAFFALWCGVQSQRYAEPTAAVPVRAAPAEPAPLDFLLASPVTLHTLPDFDHSPVPETKR
jgi:hypothetical protein